LEVLVKAQAGENSSDKILMAATRIAQAHGYSGLNLRSLAEQVGIKAASLYHHFSSKADLAAAVAKRYWEDAAARLEVMTVAIADPLERLRQYPQTFRMSLEIDNRMCLSSFMGAEYDDLPEVVMKEVQTFADVNVQWLAKTIIEAGITDPENAGHRAHAIFAAVAGAQLVARSRSDISLFDATIENYQAAGLLPGRVEPLCDPD
jgi:TetR/AcrR family transcriptional repressor of nem operon